MFSDEAQMARKQQRSGRVIKEGCIRCLSKGDEVEGCQSPLWSRRRTENVPPSHSPVLCFQTVAFSVGPQTSGPGHSVLGD